MIFNINSTRGHTGSLLVYIYRPTSRSGVSLLLFDPRWYLWPRHNNILKQACPSEKIRSHLFMNRAIYISLNSSGLSRCLYRMGNKRVLFKLVIAHVLRRLEKHRHIASVRLTCM